MGARLQSRSTEYSHLMGGVRKGRMMHCSDVSIPDMTVCMRHVDSDDVERRDAKPKLNASSSSWPVQAHGLTSFVFAALTSESSGVMTIIIMIVRDDHKATTTTATEQQRRPESNSHGHKATATTTEQQEGSQSNNDDHKTTETTTITKQQ